MRLYGQCPDRDIFSVISCRICGLVLKLQALKDHTRKRHSKNDFLVRKTEFPRIKQEVSELSQIGQKFGHNLNNESLPTLNSNLFTEPQSLCQLQAPMVEPETFQYSQSFTLPNPLKRSIAHQSAAHKLKMKIRKVDQDMWRIVNVNV